MTRRSMSRRALLLLAPFGAEAQVVAPAGSPSSIPVVRPRMDVFKVSAQTYALSGQPITGMPFMVFLNGLLMLQGANADYVLADSTVLFVGQAVSKMDQALVQVLYYV